MLHALTTFTRSVSYVSIRKSYFIRYLFQRSPVDRLGQIGSEALDVCTAASKRVTAAPPWLVPHCLPYRRRGRPAGARRGEVCPDADGSVRGANRSRRRQLRSAARNRRPANIRTAVAD